MKKIFVTLIFLYSTHLYSKPIDIFTLQASIIIKTPIEKIFSIAGNTINDKLWRSEVNSMHADGDFELGTRYIEDARLGKHPSYITEVEIITIKTPEKVVYQTIDSNPYLLKSYRLFKKLSPLKTKFTYKVKIEKGMIKDIIGVNMPAPLVKLIYRSRMITYLKRLKVLIEKKEN